MGRRQAGHPVRGTPSFLRVPGPFVEFAILPVICLIGDDSSWLEPCWSCAGAMLEPCWSSARQGSRALRTLQLQMRAAHLSLMRVTNAPRRGVGDYAGLSSDSPVTLGRLARLGLPLPTSPINQSICDSAYSAILPPPLPRLSPLSVMEPILASLSNPPLFIEPLFPGAIPPHPPARGGAGRGALCYSGRDCSSRCSLLDSSAQQSPT